MKVPKTLVPPDAPVLHVPATPVATTDLALLRDLASGLDRVLRSGTGIGLALPQVGIGLRGFVLRDTLFIPRRARFCFNPRVVESSPETEMAAEGCLSLPGQRFEVTRPKAVKVEYYNAKGQLETESLRGLPARCFQHELDHLDGKLINRFPAVGAPKPARESIPALTPPRISEAPAPGIFACRGVTVDGVADHEAMVKELKEPSCREGQRPLRVDGFERWPVATRKTAAQQLKGWVEDYPAARVEVFSLEDAQVLLCQACPDLNGRVQRVPVRPPAPPLPGE